MHSEIGNQERNVNIDEEDKVDADEEFVEESFTEDDGAAGVSDSDNVGDVSVEINVEELIAEIELAHDDESDRRAEVRRRLDELRDQREVTKELEDTFMTYLDDED